MANWLRPSKNTHQKPEPLRTYEAKARRCLMCRETFASSWPGERVCPSCKTTIIWRVRGEFVLTRRPGVRKGHRNAFPK